MHLIPALLFLAQALPAPTDHPAHPRPHRSHHAGQHALGEPVPTPSPSVRVTIVNATSQPAISLSVTGTNRPVAYPFFPQGTWTAAAPVTNTEVHYLARNTNGATVAERTVRYRAVSSQILLLTGDLGTTGPSDRLPSVAPLQNAATKPWPPNFQFHVYPWDKGGGKGCSYRVVNGMPGKCVLLRIPAGGGKAARQLALLAPGDGTLLQNQPPSVEWQVEIEGRVYPLPIRQEGTPRNCLIPFFLREGKPSIIRIFEPELESSGQP